MGNFADQMGRAATVSVDRCRAIHERSAELAFASIVDGSPITGAAGQPVAAAVFEKSGTLRDSWWKTRTDRNRITIGTNLGYARAVEDNLRGVHFHNHGPHSVKITVLGGPAIVRRALLDVGGGAQ